MIEHTHRLVPMLGDQPLFLGGLMLELVHLGQKPLVLRLHPFQFVPQLEQLGGGAMFTRGNAVLLDDVGGFVQRFFQLCNGLPQTGALFLNGDFENTN